MSIRLCCASIETPQSETLLTVADYSLVNGGAMVAFWGWIIMSLITVCIAVSLGEIASCSPKVGGQGDGHVTNDRQPADDPRNQRGPLGR
jgi:amino acid permease